MAMQRASYYTPPQVHTMVATVPAMCCSECGAAMVRAALHGARGVRGVIVDLRNLQITVTGYHHADLLQALQRLRSFGAQYYRTQQLAASTYTSRGGDRDVVVYGETRYTRTQCPAYRAGASGRTHYINPT